MNLKKIFLFGIAALSFHPTLPKTRQETPLNKLWNGVFKSDVRKVEQALAEGADLSVRFGRYGDTALMTALRIYCQSMTELPRSRFSRVVFTVSAALLSAAGMYYLTESRFLSSLALSGAYLFAKDITVKFSPASAKIVELLIKAEKNIHARNKEGITALDILRAYFPYAYQLRDENWYKFLYLLLKKGSQK